MKEYRDEEEEDEDEDEEEEEEEEEGDERERHGMSPCPFITPRATSGGGGVVSGGGGAATGGGGVVSGGGSGGNGNVNVLMTNLPPHPPSLSWVIGGGVGRSIDQMMLRSKVSEGTMEQGVDQIYFSHQPPTSSSSPPPPPSTQLPLPWSSQQPSQLPSQPYALSLSSSLYMVKDTTDAIITTMTINNTIFNSSGVIVPRITPNGTPTTTPPNTNNHNSNNNNSNIMNANNHSNIHTNSDTLPPPPVSIKMIPKPPLHVTSHVSSRNATLVSFPPTAFATGGGGRVVAAAAAAAAAAAVNHHSNNNNNHHIRNEMEDDSEDGDYDDGASRRLL